MFDRADYATLAEIPATAASELDNYRRRIPFDSSATDQFARILKSSIPVISHLDHHFDDKLYWGFARVCKQVGYAIEDFDDPSELSTRLQMVVNDLKYPSGLDSGELDNLVSFCRQCSVEFIALSASD